MKNFPYMTDYVNALFEREKARWDYIFLRPVRQVPRSWHSESEFQVGGERLSIGGEERPQDLSPRSRLWTTAGGEVSFAATRDF